MDFQNLSQCTLLLKLFNLQNIFLVHIADLRAYEVLSCIESRNAHSFIKVRGSITVPSTSWKTSLDMAVVNISKNFLYNQLSQLFGRFPDLVHTGWNFYMGLGLHPSLTSRLGAQILLLAFLHLNQVFYIFYILFTWENTVIK
jgi:hypothetical protein